MEAAAKATGLSDGWLVERLKAGDLEAFGKLVVRYQDRVYNAVWRICGHADDAADLTQDAFIKAYESIASFRGQSAFYTWLFRIAVNLAISHRRTRKRKATQSLDAPLGPEVEGSQAATLGQRVPDKVPDDPTAGAESNETHSRVAAALAQLDDEFRAVIVLRDIEGLDYSEIAEVLNIAPGTVKSRLHRGRLALRDVLEPCGKRVSG